MSSSSSELLAAENISMPENKEISPLSSEAKAISKKPRLEEDSSTVVGPFVCVTSENAPPSAEASVLGEISPKVQGRELILLDHSGLNSLIEVDGRVDDGASISSSTIAPLILLPTPTPTSHAMVQVSFPVADPPAETSSGHTASDLLLPSPPLTEAPSQGSDTDPPPSKRARLDVEPASIGSKDPLALVISDTNINAFPKPSPFVVLPVELLSEILISTGSPEYVLAVARTCTALCQTLLSTDNQFIWRFARRACVFDSGAGPVYLPDPPQGFFGEAAYAAFVFDSGACDVCGKETSMMYKSFALRLRICKESKCRRSACQNILYHAPDHAITEIIPFTESTECFGTRDYCRASDSLKARIWIETAPKDDAFQKKYTTLRERNVEWMEFAVSVHKWKYAREAQYFTIKRFNESRTTAIANKLGWDRSDMINTAYGVYLKQRNKLMEKVVETDVRAMLDQIESQLVALSEKRSRRAADIALLENRGDVEKYYNSILSRKVHRFLPSLPTFRQLPIIKQLQSAPAPNDINIAQTLESNSLMNGLLSDQLKQWVETAKEDFAALLGFPKKKRKIASKNVLHPVEKVTAKFRCIRCAKPKGGSGTDDGCLDFAAACSHVCISGPGRTIRGKRGMWDVSNFVKDEKAINALNKMIQALGYNEDTMLLMPCGFAVLCTSCDPSMVLDSRSVVGHCHRHDAMELSFTSSVDTIASYLGGYPITYGVTEKLLGSARSSKGKKAIGRKNYGCRHCLRAEQVEPVAVVPGVTAENEGSGGEEAGENEGPKGIKVRLSTVVWMYDPRIQGPREIRPRLFNFNGMISHMKAKHGIESIRDEDFLCCDDVDL